MFTATGQMTEAKIALDHQELKQHKPATATPVEGRDLLFKASLPAVQWLQATNPQRISVIQLLAELALQTLGPK